MSGEDPKKESVSEKDKPFVLALVSFFGFIGCIVLAVGGASVGNNAVADVGKFGATSCLPLAAIMWEKYKNNKNSGTS